MGKLVEGATFIWDGKVMGSLVFLWDHNQNLGMSIFCGVQGLNDIQEHFVWGSHDVRGKKYEGAHDMRENN